MRLQHIPFHRWIPPKLTPNLNLMDASRVRRIIDFYARLPRGPAPTISPRNWVEQYKKTYFNGRGKAQPVLHAIGGLVIFGYILDYYFHLRYHKHSIHE
ncbi:hypothetical protein PNEG_02908 [Pneumocystis murina B123]|uniref:ATP synthase subunit f, mitochondrial n=1 Tax=Pneumocystis murina (strain B123) TaxID=1069680 RepID=M7NJE5_PNEMU|nr:hypothetical protein PNEG_02908 [Pneumocystis murina B123]EMR08733.1 hypothetical protein PNEG_02908 [Pneumocystis murina B123]